MLDNLLIEKYKKLKEQAEKENELLYEDYAYFQFRRLDSDIMLVEEILYEYLQKIRHENSFKGKAMALFNYDFPNFFKNEISKCSYALYIIKHKKEYKRLLKIKENIYQYEWNRNIDIEEVNSNICNSQIKLDELITEKSALENKKYNIFELIKRERKIDKIKIFKLSKEINNIQVKLANLEKESTQYNNDLKSYENLKKSYTLLSKKLKKPFKNFSINENSMDLYINDRFGELVSLELLVSDKDEFKNRLKQLLINQEKAKLNYKYVKSSFYPKEINKKDYDLEIK